MIFMVYLKNDLLDPIRVKHIHAVAEPTKTTNVTKSSKHCLTDLEFSKSSTIGSTVVIFGEQCQYITTEREKTKALGKGGYNDSFEILVIRIWRPKGNSLVL